MEKKTKCSSAILLGLAMFALAHIQMKQQAHGDGFSITVGSGTAKAACHTSGSDGSWTFSIGAISGKLSRVSIQIYTGSRPGSGDAICDPNLGDCANGIVGGFAKVGEVILQNPRVGKSGTITLPANAYCVRLVKVGNGTVTVVVTHP